MIRWRNGTEGLTRGMELVNRGNAKGKHQIDVTE
jgi:hypothetical protein